MSEQPTDKRYRYLVKYVIVDQFGEVRWIGTADIRQDKPRPTDEAQAAAVDALTTSKTIRASCPPEAPAGRVLVTAAFPR